MNELIAIIMEDEDVFNEYHSLLLDLYEDIVIHGLRPDHIDGLHEPGEYINEAAGAVLVKKNVIWLLKKKKILEEGEKLPAQWPITRNNRL